MDEIIHILTTSLKFAQKLIQRRLICAEFAVEPARKLVAYT